MRKRKHISNRVKLAAMVLAWDRRAHVDPIDYDHAKTMTADQIISLVHFDHWPIPHAEDGPDEPWNLEPRFILDHRAKTRRDLREIAKNKRIWTNEVRHKRALADEGRSERVKRALFPPGRKLPSRGFARRKK